MSDTTGKVKTYRNPDRSRASDYKPYVPQYQVHGKEPQEYHGAVVPGGIQITRPNPLPSDNPRAKRAPIRQPYAEATVSPIGRGRGPVPNVGNNMEHTWSSVDGEIIDDLDGQEADLNQEMVDNNDFVTDQALGYQSGPTAADIQPHYQVFPPQALEQEVQAVHQPAEPDDLIPVLCSLEDDAHLLIVSGVPVCSGPKEEIEDQARALVFGEHEMCDGNPVPVDDIVILKRVKVKVGLFLE
jgi:hypothetical protein